MSPIVIINRQSILDMLTTNYLLTTYNQKIELQNIMRPQKKSRKINILTVQLIDSMKLKVADRSAEQGNRSVP